MPYSVPDMATQPPAGGGQPTMTGQELLSEVSAVLERLVVAAEPFQGLFPSILDRRTCQMPASLPPGIEGQRDGDRAFPGSNLLHDTALLALMYDLAEIDGRRDFALAANRYVQRFAEHCTNIKAGTGLFPWGEHAFWDLRRDCLGNSHRHYGLATLPDPMTHHCVTHDHLRPVPVWLWERLAHFNEEAVIRFAHGLDFHWSGGTGHPPTYCRHAFVNLRAHPGYVETDPCDFPRHSGFYVLDVAFAWSRSRESVLREKLMRWANYWWEQRSDCGLCPIESRSQRYPAALSPSQTLSLAVRLLETSGLLQDVDHDLSSCLRSRAETYLDGFLNAPHSLTDSGVVSLFDLKGPRVLKSAPLWGSRYGTSIAGLAVLQCAAAARLTGRDDLLAFAASIGRIYCQTPIPANRPLPAGDVACCLNLLTTLAELTGESTWLKHAVEMAAWACEHFLDAPLPRGALGYDWYEAQMGTGHLLNSLVSTALLADGQTPGLRRAEMTIG